MILCVPIQAVGGRWHYIHLKSDETTQFLNKPFVNEVIFRGQNLPLKCCQPLELLIHFKEGFRSFHTSNLGSVSQRAAKLLAVKVEGLKEKSATQPYSNHLTRFQLQPGQNHSKSLMDGNFVAL